MSTNRSRQLFDVPLEVIAGSRFQPTGFPDLGPATFDRPRRGDDGATVRDDAGDTVWESALLVESTQSMANRAEAVGWDPTNDQPVDVLAGLPWVRVIDSDGAYLTSSRTEAHRLASAFVKDSTLDGTDMVEVIKDRLGLRDDHPISPSAIAAAIFGLDPLCLVHGVFFAESRWPGQPKVARALTGFIEAVEVRPADSGGVKKDSVRHSLGEVAGGTAEGYGTVPYHRREWTAAEIVASFTIDRAQIRSYALGDAATGLLEAVARWEVRCLVDDPLRLRTACDLIAISSDVHDQTGEALPSRDELESEIRRGIEACAEIAGPGKAFDVVWGGGRAKKPKR
jgi:CRISPR-associated protein Csb1